jgi:CPA2 family monovalent cation:H+ antiporter-2
MQKLGALFHLLAGCWLAVMGTMQEVIFVRDLAVVLLVAAASGWLLQRVGLSAVVGYLLAGMAIGPFSPAIQLVSNLDHIHLLAQMGLVFLMFAIGLGLSLARLQRMGISIVAAVAISSLLLFNLCRLFGAAMGWNGFQTLFLAGTLMISSSAIIIRVLDELNITHQRAGQLAMGITVLEDIVAVVMLTLFLSTIKVGGGTASFWGTLGLLGTFVVLLVVVSVLAVPRVLKLLSRDSGPELRITAVAGLVLLTATWAVQAGYSMAMGAFVLGVVVAGTRYKDEVERAFEAVHNIFGAVFFVAVGMMFDFRILAQVWWLVALVTVLTLMARPFACSFGLVAVGHSTRNALKAGLALTPIGEFAFVMIQVGKSSNVLPETFYALAIGVSLATAVIGPLLTRRSEAICAWVEAHEPRPLRETIAFYHRWLAELQDRSRASLLWRLSSKRLLHVAFHLFFVSALLLASRPIYAFLARHLSEDFLFTDGLPVLFWTLLGVVVMGPLIAIWRNMEALAMIVAEGVTQRASRSDVLRPLLQKALQGFTAVILLAWLLLLVPFGKWVFWALCAAAAVVLLWLPFFWRRLVLLHSRFEVEFREKMKAASTPGSSSGLPVSVLERPQEWQLQLDEVMLPLQTEHSGRRIADLGIRSRLGCSIVAIDRQGSLIANPSAQERLYAGDKLLLLGSEEQLGQAEEFLRGGPGQGADAIGFDDIAMENVEVPATARGVGKPLKDLQLVERFGIQVCGIQRGAERILVPSSTETIQPGDRLLVLGAHERIRDFITSMNESIPPAAHDLRGLTT